MKFSEALKKYQNDTVVKQYDAARIACRHAGLYDEESSIFCKLLKRLKELSGKPIVCGI